METAASADASASSGASRGSSSASTQSPRAIASDFETFLKMMTAQIQNQDPMNPMDSGDFATQLATFSAVEQQVQTNDLLERMLAQSSAVALGQMGGWIGSEVRVAAEVAYEGSPVEVFTSPHTAATRAALVVYDGAGKERYRESIPVSEGAVEWSGLDGQGAAVPSGLYRFEVESFDADGEVIDTSPGEIYAKVLEAQTDGRSVRLVLPGSVTADLADVVALRPGD